MKHPTSAPSPAGSLAPGPALVVPLEHRIDLSALAALFWLTLRQHARGRRLLVLAALYLLPIGIAILARSLSPTDPTAPLLFNVVLTLIPHALVPLTALLYASGMIQDEIEEQTLTYLLVRPLPRWALYVTKLLATYLITALLAGFFTTTTYVAIYAGTPRFWGEVFPVQALQTSLLLALALAGYCSLFGLISLLAQRSLVIGIAYILLFEGLLANIDFAVRRLTVMYYFRTLAERWLGVDNRDWALDLDTAPSALACVLTLLGVGLVATLLAASIFSNREFRMKTPEGS
jgi:ABC-2 type transport system permease protein